MIREILKKIIPIRIRQKIRAFEQKVFGMERDYKNLSTEDAFEKIYKRGIWGKDLEGNPTSGSGSHTKSIVDPYVDAVKIIVANNNINTAIDLGCGDFAVGSKIVDLFESYTACDISSTILERNRRVYQLPSLKFEKLNLAEDQLPNADIAFVRQVLQHLSNKNIKAFVKQLNDKKKFKFLLITEHLPFSSKFAPNRDKPNGPSIRIGMNSGVVLHTEPFNLKYKEMQKVLTVDDDVGLITTTLYEL
tara:strand:- start:108 stop:848 length:741 start_codon:yes stop_codon:yes gene_type:complete